MDCRVHFHGAGSRAWPETTVPRQGDYVENQDGKLYLVSAVVFRQGLDVYAIPLAEACAEPWRRQWGDWDQAPR